MDMGQMTIIGPLFMTLVINWELAEGISRLLMGAVVVGGVHCGSEFQKPHPFLPAIAISTKNQTHNDGYGRDDHHMTIIHHSCAQLGAGRRD